MVMRIHRSPRFLILLGVVVLTLLATGTTRGSDHGDAPVLRDAGRNDARLTGFFAFTRGENLVLALCGDPTIPNTATRAVIAPDVIFRINIDNDSEVIFDEAGRLFGGTIVQPEQIKEDIVFQISFNDQMAPQLNIEGSLGGGDVDIRMFTGLTDDPFTPFRMRNVWSIVLEFPLQLVIKSQPTLLLWATSKVPGFEGDFQDLNGRAIRSQTAALAALNSLHPSQHGTVAAAVVDGVVRPDVMIYDTSQKALFPNGCDLADDTQRIVANNPMNPPRPPNEVNDRPFRETFPYLAAPWPPSAQ